MTSRELAETTRTDYVRMWNNRVKDEIGNMKVVTFVKNHKLYNTYYPMFVIMLGTALRCGELIGLTWNDVDMDMETIDIEHQLIYKNLGEGYRFYITKPKTKAGERTIPMTQKVLKAFELQQEMNILLGKGHDFEVDGYHDFIFMAKSGRPLMPSAVNNILYSIVIAYNKHEVLTAKKENRDEELMPQISTHNMRHTSCTRMEECRVDIKVLQYIMGHAHIDVTMNVYNHIGDMARVDNEIAMLNTKALSY